MLVRRGECAASFHPGASHHVTWNGSIPTVAVNARVAFEGVQVGTDAEMRSGRREHGSGKGSHVPVPTPEAALPTSFAAHRIEVIIPEGVLFFDPAADLHVDGIQTIFSFIENDGQNRAVLREVVRDVPIRTTRRQDGFLQRGRALRRPEIGQWLIFGSRRTNWKAERAGTGENRQSPGSGGGQASGQ